MSTSSRYAVEGMTCEHCVRAVSAAVGAIGGVNSVEVDLNSGALTVEWSGTGDDAAVQAAVEEAGYSVKS